MLACQPFLIEYGKELGKIDIYLDNPREPYYIKKLTVDFFKFFL